jgi:hypothetical protein
MIATRSARARFQANNVYVFIDFRAVLRYLAVVGMLVRKDVHTT